MTPGFAKSRAELPWLYYPRNDRVIINSHNFTSGAASLQDCLHAWHAPRDSGAAADDQFGSLDGTLSSVTRSDDGTGLAYSFGSLISTAGALLGVGNTLTVGMWIKATSVATRQGLFSTRGANDAGSWAFEVGAGSGGTGRLGVTTPGVFNTETNNGQVPAGTWTHVLFERQATHQGFTINGTDVSLLVNSPVAFIDNTTSKEIGRVNLAGPQFAGLLTDIVIFGRLLTGTEKAFLASQRGAIYT